MNAVVIVAAACGLIMFICGICIGILAIKSSGGMLHSPSMVAHQPVDNEGNQEYPAPESHQKSDEERPMHGEDERGESVR